MKRNLQLPRWKQEKISSCRGFMKNNSKDVQVFVLFKTRQKWWNLLSWHFLDPQRLQTALSLSPKKTLFNTTQLLTAHNSGDQQKKVGSICFRVPPRKSLLKEKTSAKLLALTDTCQWLTTLFSRASRGVCVCVCEEVAQL